MNLAEALNLQCACRTVDADALREQFVAHPALASFAASWAQTHPHLFSATDVFLDPGTFARLRQSIHAIERIAALPAWQHMALAGADPLAQLDFGPHGAFMGYDFHVSAQGLHLIEINTNAGGAFMNAALARAHRACCAPAQVWHPSDEREADPLRRFAQMFRDEWRAQRGASPWRSVLVADDEPDHQYLAPEFTLARAMFADQGLVAAIGDARACEWRDGRLWHPALPPGVAVDMVYNRVTDFPLHDPAHAALRSAALAGAIVLTPHPRAHALLADKRRLVTLGDPAALQGLGASADDCAILADVVPRTWVVSDTNASDLWARRRELFFKPRAGFGSRAAYRGDKLTQRVWREILAGDYVAQALALPGERIVAVDGERRTLKFDVRAYTYRGQVLMLAARTYSGQTTNFRTPGGGFASVVVLPASAAPAGLRASTA